MDDLIKTYKDDLLDYSTLMGLMNIDFKSLKVNDIINKIVECQRLINVYDKYYNIYAIVNKCQNQEVEHIINLYSTYDLMISKFITFFNTNYKMEDIDDSNKLFMKKIIKEVKNDLYDQLYHDSEKIYNINKSRELELNKKFELVKQYVSLKEQMATTLGYNNYLDYRLNDLGLSKSVFDELINLQLDKLPIDENSKISISIDKALLLIKRIANKYLDDSVLTKLDADIYRGEGSFVLKSYRKRPFISINYDDNLESMDRLFHELSHAYHYEIADKNRLIDYDPSQFISEMFAMTNEIVLQNSLTDYNMDEIKTRTYNSLFIDAIKSLKLEYFMHNNWKTITLEQVADFDYFYEKHLNYIFNDYYDINYAYGYVIAMLLANKILLNEVDVNMIHKMLGENGNKTASDMLINVGIELNNINNINEFKKIIISKNKRCGK